MKRALSAFMFVLLLVNTLTFAFNTQNVKAIGTIYIRADGSIDPPTAPIQRDGDYYTLTGNITVSSYEYGIVIERNNMTLDGASYTVQGTGFTSFGIVYESSKNVTIRNTNINNLARGIMLYSSSNNTISGNNITNNEAGIVFGESSNNNNISENSITANSAYGIYLGDSSNNSISGNNITNNGEGVGLNSYSCNNTISGNNITNNALGIDVEISSNYNSVVGNNITNNSQEGIYLCSSSNNSILVNNIANNDLGIELFESSNNSISGNEVIANTDVGIYLLDSSCNNGIVENNVTATTRKDGICIEHYSNYNSIVGNHVTNSNRTGIHFHMSSSNFVYHNNFINNTSQVYSWDSVNVWDDGYPSGGNYWSDYAGVDLHNGPSQNETGSDGMGDTPYVIDPDNRDNYPLMHPWSSGWKLDFVGPTNHPIVDFAVYDGSLYAAADNKLYVKDGSSWNVVDAPTFVTSLEPYGGKLVVGGQGGLYCYDETSFSLIFSVSTYIKVLGAYNNTLYAGTFLDKPPILYYCNGNADNPDNWHIDTSFSAILNFSGPFGSVDSFAEYDGNLYVTSGRSIYSYNETGWNAVKTFDDVYGFSCMQAYNDKLYLATRDQGWRKPAYQGYSGFNGRVFEFDGTNWKEVFEHDYWIFSLEVYNGKLYAGTANKIYTFNGTDWDASFYSADGAYYAISMITYAGKVYAGMGNGYIFADPAPTTANPETIVVPEFSSNMILAVFMALTMLAAALTGKNRTKRFD